MGSHQRALLCTPLHAITPLTALSALSVFGLPPHRIPRATGLSNVLRICASAFGASPAFADAWSRLASAGLDDAPVLTQVDRMVARQAHTRAADDVVLLASWIFLAMIPLVGWARPPRVAARSPR